MSSPRAGIVELIGNPRPESRTRALADAVSAALRPNGVVDEPVTVLELGRSVAVSFGPQPAQVAEPVDDLVGVVRSARVLVVATPTYKATYSGLLKIVLDQLTQGDLAGALAVPVAIAGVEDHRRQVGETLSAVLVELGADVTAPVVLLESELDQTAQIVARWAASVRIPAVAS